MKHAEYIMTVIVPGLGGPPITVSQGDKVIDQFLDARVLYYDLDALGEALSQYMTKDYAKKTIRLVLSTEKVVVSAVAFPQLGAQITITRSAFTDN
jgi:hypothetical protein